MKNNDLDKEIDDMFDKFNNTLDVNNFGLYIDPQPLNPNDDVEIEQQNETKELNFSWHWVCSYGTIYIYIVYNIYN